MDKWDRFDQQMRSTLPLLGFEDSLEVFEPTETFSQGDGWDVSYPASPTATIDAEITAPDASGDRDEGGTTVDADVLIFAPDDTGLNLTEFGESGEAPARVEDVATGVRYEIETAVSEHNGLLRLAANRA